MSDTGYQRRQPPSPLVFSPETVLSHIPSQAQYGSNPSSHGSGSNTVSMPFVRRHVTRRLKAAKAECDKELQRVTNNITAFFEERLRVGDHETERELRDRERGRDRDRDSQMGDPEALRDAFVFQSAELGSALQAEDYSSDGGYEAEVEYGLHSRQRAYPYEEHPVSAPTLTHWASSPGLHAASSGSQMSPGSLRRQSTAPWDKPLGSSMSTGAITSSPASSTVHLPDAPLTRKMTNPSPAPTSWGTGGASSRRLSRTIHIPTRPTRSGQSSRSTSRSRSPLPPLSTHTSFSDYMSSGPSTANRRSSRILVDDPVDPIMTALYDIIGVATDVTDMSIAQLTAQPKICESLVQRVQNIGKAWDEHPDWHGRNWYVQVLLAVASLSRVVEWWEAEKQFWNFDDNDDEQDEPLTFVTKPADEPITVPSSSKPLEPELDGFRLNDDDENRLRLTRPTSQTRKSRGEQLKDLSSTSASSRENLEVPSRIPSTMKENAESARVLATERLRLQAETAHNQNIVIELSLDGDHFIWINHAWRVVVGYVSGSFLIVEPP
jgi:serine/threonine-protein kinase RIM15